MTDIRSGNGAFDLIAASAAAAETRRRRVRIRNFGTGLVGFLVLLLVWKLGVTISHVPPYILPAPEQVALSNGKLDIAIPPQGLVVVELH